MPDASGNAADLVTWFFLGRIALKFVFAFLVTYLLFNVVGILLNSFGMFSLVREAPGAPLCTCGKRKYCLRDYDCRFF
jgi:hypothetical protein